MYSLNCNFFIFYRFAFHCGLNMFSNFYNTKQEQQGNDGEMRVGLK